MRAVDIFFGVAVFFLLLFVASMLTRQLLNAGVDIAIAAACFLYYQKISFICPVCGIKNCGRKHDRQPTLS